MTHGTHTLQVGRPAAADLQSRHFGQQLRRHVHILRRRGPGARRQQSADCRHIDCALGVWSVTAARCCSRAQVCLPPLIRQYGGGATQFSLNAGIPVTTVNQFDAGVFANDDWRMRPNLTLSYGLRYEAQTNISDYGNFAPRVGVAWGVDSRANKPGKTVLRAGFGIFYDRLADTVTVTADRFNGLTQQSYLILNPDFFPTIPSLATLNGARQAQQLQLVDSHFVAPRTYQASIGVDRQINKYARVSVTYLNSRGVHLLRQRNINTPINGVYPDGDNELRILNESTGFSRSNQVIVSPSLNYKKMFVFGFYALSYG